MARVTAQRRKARTRAASGRFQAVNVDLGDRIRVERKFVIDGVLTSVADKGVFHGIQAMGSIEHLLLESKGEVRLIPIPSISEIVLEGLREKRQSGPEARPFDPGFA